MKNKKIRTSPLTLPEHFGVQQQLPAVDTQKSENTSSWPWVLGTALLVLGVTVLVLPKISPKYVTKEDALAEKMKNDEKHLQYLQRHKISMAKVKHEIRKTKRRQKTLEQRIDDLEYDLFDNA